MARVNRHGRLQDMPEPANDYNRWMGGVDLGDMLIKKFAPTMKSRKMWRKLLINMILRMTGKSLKKIKTHILIYTYLHLKLSY